MSDPYETLGLEPGSSPELAKTKYRELAMECHPDRFPNDSGKEQKFKEISEAYGRIVSLQQLDQPARVAGVPSIRNARMGGRISLASKLSGRVRSAAEVQKVVADREMGYTEEHLMGSYRDNVPTRPSGSGVNTDHSDSPNPEVPEYAFGKKDLLTDILEFRDWSKKLIEERVLEIRESDPLVDTVYLLVNKRETETVIAHVRGGIERSSFSRYTTSLAYANDLFVKSENRSMEDILKIADVLSDAKDLDQIIIAGSVARAILDNAKENILRGRKGRKKYANLFVALAGMLTKDYSESKSVDMASLPLMVRGHAPRYLTSAIVAEETAELIRVAGNGRTIEQTSSLLSSTLGIVDSMLYVRKPVKREFHKKYQGLVDEIEAVRKEHGHTHEEIQSLINAIASLKDSSLNFSGQGILLTIGRYIKEVATVLSHEQSDFAPDFASAIKNGARGYLDARGNGPVMEWKDTYEQIFPIYQDQPDIVESIADALCELKFNQEGAIEYGQGINLALNAATYGIKRLIDEGLSRDDVLEWGGFLEKYTKSEHAPTHHRKSGTGMTTATVLNLTPKEHQAYGLLGQIARKRKGFGKGKMVQADLKQIIDIYLN